jgi:putative ABC transport system ATP-binding protein
MKENTVIDVEGITRSYRKGAIVTEVLKGVSFRLDRGEMVAIMGPSGSGKSTLLNILGFLDRPDGGRYQLEGADLSHADDDALSAVRNRKIGFVFQQFHLLARTSALRNVMLPLLYADEDAAGGDARAMHALEAVGLGHRAQHRPGELSGGEQQRVTIARALINDPALILADEPTGNLDARSGEEILGIFRRLHDTGRTIILVTHDRAVAEHADRILVLEDGRITSDTVSAAHDAARSAPT